jgi:hypothetical protein
MDPALAGVISGTNIVPSALIRLLDMKGHISMQVFAAELEYGIKQAESDPKAKKHKVRTDLIMIRQLVSLLRTLPPQKT